MKLNIWTLCAWLEKAGMQPVPEISDGKTNFSCARLMEKNTPLPNTVSIVPAKSVSSRGAFSTVLISGVDNVFIPGADSATVLNEVIQAFDFYNHWETELLNSLLDDSPLQSMLDIAHIVFRRPMFIKGDSSPVFAITPGYPASVHPDWEKLEKSVLNRTADFDSVRTVSLDPVFQMVFQHKYPAVLKSPFYGGMILRSNVWLGEQRVFEIVTIENGIPFNQGEPQLMHFFAQMLERHVSRNKHLYFTLSELSDFFVSILENKDYGALHIDKFYQTANWQKADSLAMICAKSKALFETPLQGVLRDKLNEELRFRYVFVYGDSLWCIINVTKNKGYENVISKIAGIIPGDAFNWAISYEFVGIERISEFYEQAVMAYKLAVRNNKPYMTMYQAASICFAERMHEFPQLLTFVHPDIRKLEEIDTAGNTQYLATLFTFLVYGGNYSDAAKSMNLHRNSLIYRISKIREIISCDLNDIQNRILLLCSYFILGKGM